MRCFRVRTGAHEAQRLTRGTDMGQGGSSSLEDAAALAATWAAQGAGAGAAEVPEMLAAFAALRQARVHQMQTYSRIQGSTVRAGETRAPTMNAMQFARFAFGDPGFVWGGGAAGGAGCGGAAAAGGAGAEARGAGDEAA